MRGWCVCKAAHPLDWEPLRRGPRPHRLCMHPLGTVPGSWAGPPGHRKTNQQEHSLKAVRCITVLGIRKGRFFRARQRARVRQPSWGLFGFWGRKTCWGLECFGTGPGQPRLLGCRAEAGTHLHSSLCVPVISSWPCSRPQGRRLCPTLQMRKWRVHGS